MATYVSPSSGPLAQASIPAAFEPVRRRQQRRTLIVTVILSLLTVAAFIGSMAVGDFRLSPVEVVASIFGQGSSDSEFVVGTLRLPRALTAVLVGAAFGLSGAIFQSLARNPLASPDIIGVSNGASAAAVFAIVVFGAGAVQISIAALIGAALAMSIAVSVSSRKGLSPGKFILIGIGVSAVMAALTQYLLTRADILDAQRATVWLTGSVNARTWEHVWIIAISLIVLVPLTIWVSRPLQLMQLGPDTANGLGVRVNRTNLTLVFLGVALAAMATASAGPIAFVAFVCGPIARRINKSPLALGTAALLGAVLVTGADIVTRLLFGATELPVGVVTAIIGAPYLVYLLARHNRVGQGG